ncbi:divalent metal cation transporter [Ornithobacterium rhinotracheale]|uniref:Divalent metal cation transporter MntH n=1 Tax=Ornithobacterium rhinotracheale TaxID=28251 RepID=A0A410JTM4_ORNRH|nr:Nramp family divalent metal transporter [Ornithobacterium rhinotracheale]QAR31401.1 divalent metal cation transporter [Ornithobacterium rhinotracheale]
MKKKAWNRERLTQSLAEAHASINIPENSSFWRKLLAFVGPGLMVAVGYMDPGNWATDIEGGAKFGYTLLFVILLSNFFAMFLQYLALKLGIATERDLAQACRDHYNPTVNFILWILCEIAIAAMDLAEVIGSAIALNLLFGIPLPWGVAITVADVFLILFLQAKGFRKLESVVGALIIIIAGCFMYELMVSSPNMPDVMKGLLPQPQIVTNPSMLYIAVGILGATVMPHNLYLHSSLVQTRNYKRSENGKKMAIKYATIESNVSLLLAFFINAAILITAAATFHGTPYENVADIHDAYHMLTPVLGASLASTLFAVALLASGQNSTITGTLAGQIVMEGFLNLRLKPWVRRLITRLIAVIPAMIVAILYGERGTNELLILSQVILSMQLSFAVIPLVMFTNSRAKMGQFVNSFWAKIMAWSISIIIVILNIFLLIETFNQL